MLVTGSEVEKSGTVVPNSIVSVKLGEYEKWEGRLQELQEEMGSYSENVLHYEDEINVYEYNYVDSKCINYSVLDGFAGALSDALERYIRATIDEDVDAHITEEVGLVKRGEGSLLQRYDLEPSIRLFDDGGVFRLCISYLREDGIDTVDFALGGDAFVRGEVEFIEGEDMVQVLGEENFETILSGIQYVVETFSNTYMGISFEECVVVPFTNAETCGVGKVAKGIYSDLEVVDNYNDEWVHARALVTLK